MPAIAQDRSAVLAQLKAHLQQVAPMRVAAPRLATGLPALDARTAGWPRPGLALIQGAAGSGRLGVVLPALGRLSRSGRSVAIVDPVGWLHPPGLVGVVLERLLLVRPGTGRAVWAAEQLARCGGVPLVVLLDPPPLRSGGRRLLHAAEAGDSTVVVVSEAPQQGLPASLSLQSTHPGEVWVRRGGRGGRTGPVRLDGPGGHGAPLSVSAPEGSRTPSDG